MIMFRISLRKVVNRHVPATQKITVCLPANAKKCSFRVNLTPTCYLSRTSYLGGGRAGGGFVGVFGVCSAGGGGGGYWGV